MESQSVFQAERQAKMFVFLLLNCVPEKLALERVPDLGQVLDGGGGVGGRHVVGCGF